MASAQVSANRSAATKRRCNDTDVDNKRYNSASFAQNERPYSRTTAPDEHEFDDSVATATAAATNAQSCDSFLYGKDAVRAAIGYGTGLW